MARLHGQVRILALQGLYASHLIHTDGRFASCGSLSRTGIHLTLFTNFLVALGIRNFRQPGAEAVRLQSLFLTAVPRVVAKSAQQCLVSSVRQRSPAPSTG